ncbi:MAG: hypothetical protein MUC60_08985 [Oscillatoria sp. Prado101]|nr:hypothetical protein [Oscillatoria sp. Prado101]
MDIQQAVTFVKILGRAVWERARGWGGLGKCRRQRTGQLAGGRVGQPAEMGGGCQFDSWLADRI